MDSDKKHEITQAILRKLDTDEIDLGDLDEVEMIDLAGDIASELTEESSFDATSEEVLAVWAKNGPF